MDEADQRARLEPFQALIGEWATEMTHPMFRGTVVSGRTTFEWLEGGRFLIQRATNEHPDFPDSLCVIGVVEGENDLSMQYFDSRGVHRIYAIGFDGAELTVTRDAQGFAQRLSAKLSDEGSTFAGVWQLNEDDRGYRDDLAFTYRRVVRTDGSMGVAEREAMARGIVDGNSYMTLGTADADGEPWASPVWYAAASYREFFWVSKPGARHSQNIAVRPEVSIVIFDSTVPIGTGKAVYMAARAEEVTAVTEIERGMSIFSRRSLEHGGREWTPDDVGVTTRLRLYRGTASEQFVLSPNDERLPFTLE
jgi:hypothetical protein